MRTRLPQSRHEVLTLFTSRDGECLACDKGVGGGGENRFTTVRYQDQNASKRSSSWLMCNVWTETTTCTRMILDGMPHLLSMCDQQAFDVADLVLESVVTVVQVPHRLLLRFRGLQGRGEQVAVIDGR